MMRNEIICGDCLQVLPTLPRATMIFADPPDNLNLKYMGYSDNLRPPEYGRALTNWINAAIRLSDIAWFSVNPIHRLLAESFASTMSNTRLFIWRQTFGQHNDHDCGYGYRPIIRMTGLNAVLYPDAIRVPSKRQTVYNDKRANPAGRVPDDVWEFPRICGTFKERRKWHPTQHPEALIERIIRFSTQEGDLVTDMFAGSGTTNRVCKRLNRQCIGIDISPYYCEKIKEELNNEIPNTT